MGFREEQGLVFFKLTRLSLKTVPNFTSKYLLVLFFSKARGTERSKRVENARQQLTSTKCKKKTKNKELVKQR